MTPTTDRLAIAAPGHDGVFRPLSGNQIGVLLANHLLSPEGGDGRLVLNTVVSTPMLGVIAEHAGAGYHRTLTGFKWIWNAALDLEAAGDGTYLFGFEEALGYCVDRAVRDKDGIAAALSFADMVAGAADRGALVDDLLGELYQRHGLWVSTQRSIVREGTEGAQAIGDAMVRLAADPSDRGRWQRDRRLRRLREGRRCETPLASGDTPCGAWFCGWRPDSGAAVGNRAKTQDIRRLGCPDRRRRRLACPRDRASCGCRGRGR